MTAPSLAYVIGVGPESIQIPLLAFLSPEDAHSHLASLGLVHHKTEETNGATYYEGVKVGETVHELGFFMDSDYHEDDSLDAESERLRNALLASGDYETSHGEISALYIKTLPIGSPVVGWRL